MTQPQHTPGRLHFVESGKYFSLIGPDDYFVVDQVYILGDAKQTRADFERIAALWNAFENIPTSDIPGLMEAHLKEVEGLRELMNEFNKQALSLLREVKNKLPILSMPNDESLYMAYHELKSNIENYAQQNTGAEGRGGNG